MQKSWYVVEEWDWSGMHGPICYDDIEAAQRIEQFFLTEKDLVVKKMLPLEDRRSNRNTILQLTPDGKRLERKDLERLIYGRLAWHKAREREKAVLEISKKRRKRKQAIKNKEKERREKIEQELILDEIGRRIEAGDKSVSFSDIIRYDMRDKYI